MTFEDIIKDQCSSDWIRLAAAQLRNRDLVDAVNDVEALKRAAMDELNALVAQSQQAKQRMHG